MALHAEDAALSTYTGPMMLEFLAGAWLHRAWSRGWMPIGWQATSCAALGVLLLGVWARVPLVDIEAWRALVYGLPALLVATAALGLEAGGRLPGVPELGRIGDSSYTLYLTHLFVLQAIRPVMLQLPAVAALPLAATACVTMGWAVHRWVEVPIGLMLRQRGKPGVVFDPTGSRQVQ